MACYLDGNGNYYEGDQAHATDREVSQRPDALHVATYDDAGAFLEWTLSIQPTPVSTDDAMRAGLLKVWRLADPVSASRDPDYQTLAAAEAEDANVKGA